MSKRYSTHRVKVAGLELGGGAPVLVQSMTNTSTKNTEDCVEQILRLEAAACPLVRLTAQGISEGENLRNIVEELRKRGSSVAIVADIHFTPNVATIAAKYVDKVRINPGNYSLKNSALEGLIAQCKQRGVALRIGVNHGSLSEHIVDLWGDTPRGMVESALEFLRICQKENFDQVLVSMKSSNTRVMVYAYRLLVESLKSEGMSFPLHLGVTEAGNGLEGRVKSAVGIGALLADGIGDTIRVSLTEDPVAEIPVARHLVDYFAARENVDFGVSLATEYHKRSRCTQNPIVRSELNEEYTIVEAEGENIAGSLRQQIAAIGDDRPIIVKCRYEVDDFEHLALRAAADLGVIFLDGLADGIWIEAPQFDTKRVEELELMILQASRVRQSQTEYIACPSCGRTLFDIEQTLAQIKARTSHLKHLKIGVMGCIVNGPGEMADADYGYVGAQRGAITLYKNREVIERNIPQEEAIDKLIDLIKRSGDWMDA